MRWEGTSGRGRMRVTRLESYRGGQGRENKYALFPVDIVGEGEKHKEEKPSNFENEKLNKPTTTILPQSSTREQYDYAHQALVRTETSSTKCNGNQVVGFLSSLLPPFLAFDSHAGFEESVQFFITITSTSCPLSPPSPAP
jgi:hypothetical protein